MLRKVVTTPLCGLLLIPSQIFSATMWHRPPSPRLDISTQVSTLIINEYLADPPGSLATDLRGDANGDGRRDSADDEFVEVVNNGPAPLDVSGFTISDGTSIRFTFPADKRIPAGEAAVVFGGGAPNGSFGNAAANGLVFTAGAAGLSLNNGGDTITIKDAAGAVVAALSYGSAEGSADQSITRSPDVTGAFVAHSTAPGSGGALFSPGRRVNGSPMTTTDPVISAISPDRVVIGGGAEQIVVAGSNFQLLSLVRLDGAPVSTTFQDATTLNATLPASVTAVAGAHSVTVENPGSVISNAVMFTVLSGIGINEYLADPPDGDSGDANGDGTRDSAQDEFVEIINRTSTPANVGGFTISDAESARFTFPIGTMIPANEVAIVFGGGTPTADFGNAHSNGLVFTAALSLNNGGDTVALKDPGSAVVESLTYGSNEGGANQSITRSPDLSGDFVRHAAAEGSGGRLFSPGTAVDGAPFTVGPRISSITPDKARKDDLPFDLTIRGTGFDVGSQVLIDAIQVDTQPIGPGELKARVPASVTGVSGPHAVRVRNEGGNRSNAATLTIIPPPPLLSSLSPKFIVVGSGQITLFLSGLNYESGSVAFVEGLPVPTILVSSSTLRATVAGSFFTSLGTRRVLVRNSDGALSNENSLEVISPLVVLTSLAPASAIAGGPRFSLAIRGANLKTTAVARFDQTVLVTTFVSQSQLAAEVPAELIAAPGVHTVSVSSLDGQSSNELIFQVLPDPPVVTSLDPSSVVEGSGDVTVTLDGSKFQRGAVVRVIGDNGPVATLDTTFISSERLEATLPSAFIRTAGDVLLAVENPNLGLSSGARLRVLIKDPLVINEYLADPTEGLAGDANGDGSRSSSSDEFVEILNRTSEPLDISGYRLLDADGIRHVFAPGTVLPPFEATVVFGGGTPTGAFGNAAENHLVFKASSGGLSLNNGGDTITLQDPQDRVVQQIRFGAAEGGASQSINRDPDGDGSSFTLHAIAAADPSRLFSPGTKANGETFTVKPAIRGLAPESIRVGSPQFSLLVSGSRFLPGAVVVLGDSELTTKFMSDSQLEAEVSASLISSGGAVDIRVRNTRGELSAAARLLIVDDPPRVSQISPRTAGTGAGSLEVAVTGERFQNGATVLVQGDSVETLRISPMSLVAMLPASLFVRTAELSLLVQNSDGNRSNAVSLMVENGPLITRLSRGRVKAGHSEVELRLGGVAFAPGIVLFANDTAVSTIYLSESEFTVRIPAEMTSAPGTLTLQARNPDGGRSNTVTLRVVQ